MTTPPPVSPRKTALQIPAAKPTADTFLAKPHQRLYAQPRIPCQPPVHEPAPHLLRYHVLNADDLHPRRFLIRQSMSSEIDSHCQHVGELAWSERGSFNDVNPNQQFGMPQPPSELLWTMGPAEPDGEHFYFEDAKFGLVFLRVPTSAPFRLQF
jgi:hypothetical protein